MIGFIDKRFFNILVIIFLTLVTFLWAFWIFHQKPILEIIATIVIFRILASVLIFRDYSLSWSKATQKTFLLKSVVYIVPFFVYMPLFYGQVRIALFLSELFFYLFSINFLMYSYYWYINRARRKKDKSLVIYGAGSGGMKLSDEFRMSNYRLLNFIDDDKKLQKRSVDGVKILSKDALKQKTKNKSIDLLIIAMPSIEKRKINALYDELNIYFKDIKILPSLSEILRENSFMGQLKNISIEDLLARYPKDLDKNAIKNFLNGKNILVTGAGGSIGSEIVRQCLKYGVKNLYALDHSEYNLYTLKEELGEKIKPIMQSVLDKEKLRYIMKNGKFDIVIHAAAYKHVPLVEENISQGLENNIIGTKNCIDLADEYGVKKFILISTDKAVRPTNVMGASKRICELYAANKPTSSTEIVSVRFGNVLGSSGSVIPKFYAQLEKGGPITVTHPEITRYFMLISEACELVLQSGAIGKGKEVFILDMGKPIKIVDLAQKMIELSGKKDINIEFVGLRTGEKLYEELLADESSASTKYPSIFVAQNSNYDFEKLKNDIKNLISCEDKISKLKEIIPEFNHQVNL